MKIGLISIAILVVGVTSYFFVLGYLSKQNSEFDPDLAVLSACSVKPNCVCSEHPDDKLHYIEPIDIAKYQMDEIENKIRQVLGEMGAEIVIDSETYIASTFTSSLFQFVDDFEIRIDQVNKKIHIRSASKVGHSDFGENRKRAEKFSALLISQN